jgi:hypothetical protein
LCPSNYYVYRKSWEKLCDNIQFTHIFLVLIFDYFTRLGLPSCLLFSSLLSSPLLSSPLLFSSLLFSCFYPINLIYKKQEIYTGLCSQSSLVPQAWCS